jgi:hypothetical protein
MNFTRLEKLSVEINEKSNRINEQLKEFEKKLQDLNLGVEAWIEFKTEKGELVMFGYGQYEGKWRLLIAPKECGFRPVLEALRLLRIECLKHISELIICLEKECALLLEKL